jgi:hypothetical protein
MIAEGHRNVTLTSLAGVMRHRGMSFAAIDAALQAENAERCRPPLAEAEVFRIARSVSNYAPDALAGRTLKFTHGVDGQPAEAVCCPPEPEVSLPYVPFPVDALPDPVCRFVTEGAAALGCDPVFVALPTLAVVTSAIGNARAIRLKQSWEEPAVAWSATVAESGAVKSPGWKVATAPLFRAQKQRLREYRENLRAFEERRAAARAAKEDFAEAPPVYRRVVCSDVTIEKLAAILEENPRGLLVTRDELSGWLASFTRYKSNSSDLPHWLEMHRAGPMIVDRKTGEQRHCFVPRAAVSVCGGIQPRTLARSMTPEFLDAGLLARFLIAMPPKSLKRWTEAEVSEKTEKAYRELLDKLLGLTPGQEEDGTPAPIVLPLGTAAKALWIKFFGEWAAEQVGADGELAAAFAKIEAYAARFALVHSVIGQVVLSTDATQAVDEASVEAGVRLARWFADEARRVYTLLSSSQEEQDTKNLLAFIAARGGRVTVKQLQRSGRRKYRTKALAQEALKNLVDAGLAEWQERKPSSGGGRPTWDCVLITGDETPKPPKPVGLAIMPEARP